MPPPKRRSVAVAVAVATLLGAGLSLATQGQETPPARAFYLPVSVQGTGSPVVTARAVDFTELLAAAGESRPVDLASLCVWQVDRAGKLVKRAGWNYRADEGQLVWAVEAIPATDAAEYRVYFKAAAPGGASGAPDASKDPSLAPNLFCPGDFESSVISWRKGDPAERDMTVFLHGRASLRMGGMPGQPFVALGQGPQTPILVQPGRAYRISLVLKSSGRLLRTIAPHYLDAGAKTLGRDMVSGLLRSKRVGGDPQLSGRSFDWTPLQFAVKTPPGAARMYLSFVLLGDEAGGTGRLWVDDVRIEPLDVDELATIVDASTGRSCSTAVAPVAAAKSFDFGAASSPVFEGFTQVTADMLYDKARGFGFRDKSQKGRNCVYPEPLACDLVMCEPRKTSAFYVDLPDGEYCVWVLSGVNSGGDGGSSGHYETRCPYQVRVSGGDAMNVDVTAANYHKEFLFRAYYDFLGRDDALPVDVYDRCFRPLFREKVLAAKVAGGRLAVEVVPGKSPIVSPAGFLNALVVYPADKAKQADAYLAWVNRRRARLGRIKEIVTPDPAPKPVATAEDKQRGYILFTRPWSEVFRPNTRPREEQRLGQLRVAAIAGQWEPAALCVYPLEDLGNCRLSVSDLTGPDGARVPSTSVEFSVVRFLACRAQASRAYAIDGFRRDGELVLSGEAASVHAGTSREFLLTITPPAALPRGIYRGRVTVNPEKGKPSEVELAVLVIPLQLLPPEGWHTSFRYTYPLPYDQYPFPEMIDAQRKMHLAELRHMRHFRNTSAMATLHAWAWFDGKAGNPGLNALTRSGRFEFNAPKMEVFLQWFRRDILPAYQEAGITEIPIWHAAIVPQIGEVDPSRYKAGQEFLLAMYAACRDLPLRLIYDFGGEWSNDGQRGGQKGKIVYSWAKQALPAIVTGSTLNGPYCLETLGFVDFVGLRTYMFSDRQVREIRGKKGQPYVYGYPDRFSNGLYLWRVGAKGNYLTEYYTRSAHGELFNDFDSTLADLAWVHALPSPDGPVPRVRLYARAAGFLDALTLYTLESLVSKAEAGGSAQARQLAAEARRFLDELRTGIPDEYQKIEELGLKPTAESMDKTRLAAALKAYDLQQALISSAPSR